MGVSVSHLPEDGSFVQVSLSGPQAGGAILHTTWRPGIAIPERENTRREGEEWRAETQAC